MKRWVLSPTIPDPSTLDQSAANAEDSVVSDQGKAVDLILTLQPLAEVQKRLADPKQRTQAPAPARTAARPPAPVTDLLGNDAAFVSRAVPTTSTQRQTVTSSPSGNATITQMAPAPAPQAAPKPTPTQPSASLIGLDFGSGPAAPAPGARPAAPTSTPAATAPASAAQNGRPDLKKSILSLYSSAPVSQPAFQQQPANGGGFQSGGFQQQQFTQHSQQASFGGSNGLNSLTSMTGSMSLNSPTSPGQQQQASYPGFNMSLASPTSPVQQQQSQFSSMSQPAAKPQSAAFDDLFSGGASNWASSKPAQSQGTMKPTTSTSFSTSPNNAFSTLSPMQASKPAAFSASNGASSADEWADFASVPASQPAAKKMEDDIFSNVWK